MSVVLNDANCPYYQLYGPPPSYETVIAQTRGKISNPTSPESSSARIDVQSSGVVTNSSATQCFSYACNPSARLNGGLEQSPQYQNGIASPRQLENSEAIPFARYCVADAAGIRQNVCVPFNYQGQPFLPTDSFNRMYQGTSGNYVPYPMDKSSDSSDLENQNYEVPSMERYMMMNMDCTAGSSREQDLWESSDRSVSRVHGKVEQNKVEKGRGQRQSASEAAGLSPVSETEVTCANESKSTVNSSEEPERQEFSRNRRVCGGSIVEGDRQVRWQGEGRGVLR